MQHSHLARACATRAGVRFMGVTGKIHCAYQAIEGCPLRRRVYLEGIHFLRQW
jgi:hypothetical protein